jgi:hypothetical protein
MKRICAYSTADDKYIAAAAVSLLCIKQWNPSIPLFIIGRHISTPNEELLKSYGITFLSIDLSSIFFRSWEYPIECFYLFAGPELLLEKGFEYSLYVDGDIYCNNDPILDLNSISDIAGVTNGKIKDIFGPDLELIQKRWPTERQELKERLQTGVLYFNNYYLKSFDFLSKIGSLYQESITMGIPRKGDDSLFALFQHVYSNFEFKKLSKVYNFITQKSISDYRDWLIYDEKYIQNSVFYHFASFQKPWEENTEYPTYTYKYFIDKWRHRAIDILSEAELNFYFPKIDKKLRKSHLKFYWWKDNNVGDLITPYYLEKVCNVKDVSNYRINEEQISNIEKDARKTSKYGFIFRWLKKINIDTGANYCVSTGSLIRLCGDKALVFGSGVRSKNQQTNKSYVRSVRGPLTRDAYISSGTPCPNIYGDPGLLLPRFYRPKEPGKKYGLGIIPHFTEYQTVKDLYSKDLNILIINMGCGDLEHVIDQICSCERTVSSSLHGLVFSHAYNIRTCRIIFSEDNDFGDGTKYTDYYAAVNLRSEIVIDALIYQRINPVDLIQAATERLDNFDDSRLYDAMFFDDSGFRKSAYYPF